MKREKRISMEKSSFDPIVFDSWWRDRLKDYPLSPKYEKNLHSLKKEIDKTFPEEKPEKRVVFVFMGIPGVGKSAIAQIIKESIHPSVILRSDWIFFEKLKDQIKDDYYKAYVYQEDLAQRYLQEGYSVIMDDNNRTAKNRTEVYKWTQANGATPVLIIIDVDLETAAERVTLKGGETKTREEKIATLKVFQSQIEEPTPEEEKLVKIIRIDGSKPLKEITEQLKRKIESL